MSVDVRVNVWKKIADVMLKVIETGELDASLLPIFGSIAPAFLLRIAANLDIEVDDYMMQKITQNPLIEPLLMDLQTLISSTSSVSSDEDDDLNEHLNTLPYNMGKLLRIVIDNLGDEVDFTLVHPQLGLKGRIIGEGLNLIVRNGAKYLK
jgi:hypothetical protein